AGALLGRLLPQQLAELPEPLEQLAGPLVDLVQLLLEALLIGAEPVRGGDHLRHALHHGTQVCRTLTDHRGQIVQSRCIASAEGVHGATVGTRRHGCIAAGRIVNAEAMGRNGQRRGSRRPARSGPAHTTERTITLRTVWPSSTSCTRGSASTSSSRSASAMSGSTWTRWRTLPLTCTTQVTVSALTSAGSATGYGARDRDCSWPSCDHSSSARCGASGATISSSGSMASRGARSSLVR